MLLCYRLQGEQAAQIKLLAMQLGVRVRPVAQEEFAEPLISLCGWEPLTGAHPTQEAFPDPMLVLANFPQTTLDKFLSAFRERRIPSVALKAILTETNAHWDSFALHRELSEEHRAMNAARLKAQRPDATV